MEDVVAQRQSHRIAADVVGADDEGLGQTLRMVLDRIADVDAERRAVAEHSSESRRIVGGSDHLDVADAGHHQRGQRVVDHRFVVHG